MRIAYTVPGVNSTAFTPIPCINASTLNYKGGVVFQPGTQGITAPYPGVSYDQNGTRVNSGYSGGSKNMPQVWYPQLGYQHTLDIPGAEVITGGMSIFSDNQMPIPARLPWGRAAVTGRPPQFLGSRQIKAVKGLPVWSNWIPTRNFGS